MTVAHVDSVIVDPTGFNLTLYRSEQTAPRNLDEQLEKRKTFNGGVALIGRKEALSFRGAFQCPNADYAKLKRLVRRGRTEVETGTEPYGDIILHNFFEPFDEGPLAQRTRFIVPSVDDPNPHLLTQEDVGGGQFEWSYWICQQGQIDIELLSRGETRTKFTLTFTETRLKPRSEET